MLYPPLARRLELTPNGYYGAARPLRNGVHRGIDFVAGAGEGALAVAPGVIDRLGWDPPVAEGGGGGGHYVVLRFQEGDRELEAGYMHLSEVTVAKGAKVGPGVLVGLTGSSGTADGRPHLHVQVHQVQPGPRQPVDPTGMFPIGQALAGGGRGGAGPLLGLVLAAGLSKAAGWW